MKIAIDEGHNCYPDMGAVGIMDENIITKQVGELVINKLTQLGHKVTKCLPPSASSVDQSLYLRCTVANRDNVDYFVSIHANCGGGQGCEVWYKSDSGLKLGQPILDQLVTLGYKNRGMKKCGVDGSNLYVISNTNAPAVLVELFFVDSQVDTSMYNAEKLADAVVKGITGQTVSTPNPTENVHYVVCYNDDVDKRSALYLAEYLGCDCIDNSKTPFNYEGYYPICVGGGNFTSYMKLNLKGEDRFKTMLAVAKYIEERR